MDGKTYNRPALGNIAGLGALYDARNDSFCKMSIWKTKDPPESSVVLTHNHTTDIQYLMSDKYSEKFEKLGINSSLKLSILSGMFHSEGTGKYLQEEKASEKNLRMTLLYSMTTAEEELNVHCDELKNYISEIALSSDCATHIVVAIQWGAKVLVSYEYKNAEKSLTKKIESEFLAQFDKIKGCVDAGGNLGTNSEGSGKNSAITFSLRIYGDIISEGKGSIPQSSEDAIKFISSVPEMVKNSNDGKGKPLSYSLLPISYVLKLMGIPEVAILWKEISDHSVTSFVNIFDEILEIKQKLYDLIGNLKSNEYSLSIEDRQKAEEYGRDFNDLENDLKTNLKITITKIRQGKLEVEALDDLRMKYLPKSNEIIIKTNDFIVHGGYVRDKIALIKKLTDEGANIIGIGDSWENATLSKENTFILYFDETSKVLNKELWEDNLVHFRNLLLENDKKNEGEEKAKFYFVNCDILKIPDVVREDKICIQLSKNGKTLNKDVYKNFKKLRDTPIVGVYELTENGNFGEYLTAIGVWGVQWYAMMKSYSTATISESDERYTIDIVTTVGSAKHSFKLGEEFGEITADGYDAVSVVNRDLNKLIHKQTVTISIGNKTERLTIREFSEKEMKVTLTANGCTAHRIYIRK